MKMADTGKRKIADTGKRKIAETGKKKITETGRGPEIMTPEVLMELTAPHIDSFDYFVGRGISAAVANIQPVEVVRPDKKLQLRIWLDKPVFLQPRKESKDAHQRVLPSECRIGGTTYRGLVNVDVCFQWSNGNVVRHTLPFGRVPIMVKSSLCHLRGLKPDQLVTSKEEALEAGGYFICNGIERIIRLIIIPKRNIALGIKRSSYRNRGPSYSEYAVAIRCVRQDQSGLTNRLYYLTHGSANFGFSLRKQEYLIPVGLVLKALIDTSDREIFYSISSIEPEQMETVTGVLGTQFVSQRARILLQEVERLDVFTRIQCLQYVGKRFKHLLDVPEGCSFAKVGEKVLEDYIFVHVDNTRDKFNLLIFMLHKLFALADGLIAPDNPDALLHQEVLLPGHLLTMLAKEKMQEWLSRLKTQLLKEAEAKTAKFNLQDFGHVLKFVTDRVPSTDVLKRLDYLMSTGNLGSQTGLDLQQASGFTVVADKLNFLRYISHFRSVHRGAFFTTLRTTTVRKLLPESWGFLCPVHTPDGSPCGLLNHLTAVCVISSDLDSRGLSKDPLKLRKVITSELVSLGMLPAVLSLVRVSAPAYLPVQLDGRVLGHMLATSVPSAVTHLRHLKVSTNPEIPEDLEVAHVPWTSLGAYPGLYLYTTPGRFLRPVKRLGSQDKGAIELIGPYEQAYMDIRCPDGGDGGSAVGISNPTHEETSALAMLSVVASLTPWSDHNQSPRNMYQCQMAKQTLGTPAQAIAFRSDNKLYRIQTPQTPVVRTENWSKFNVDQFATGTNAIVAVLAYTGYDMEDAMILNKASVERGLCHGQVYKTETIDLTRLQKKGDGIVNVFGRSEGDQKENSDKSADNIDVDGLPYIGQVIKEGQPYCSVINTVVGNTKYSKMKGAESGVVDFVAAIGQGPKEPLQKVSIRMRQDRNPVIGDKFSSRHGQKGVLSQLWPDADMPFSAVTGMRPDLIINPHAFPSRMTIGMLLESMAAKVGALQGSFVDATPFQKCNAMEGGNAADGGRERHKSRKEESPVDTYGNQLKEYGFNYHGTEVMYSGVLGTELTCEIYLGVVYYQRLRHMVSDKYQVRSVGPVNPLTRQPVKGRKQGGGIRFGEMERDALLAHGAAYLLHDRLHKCSDYHVADICVRCGSLLAPTGVPPQKTPGGQGLGLPLGTGKAGKVICIVCNSSRDIESVAMPYVFRYLAAELAAMNIKLTLKVSDD